MKPYACHHCGKNRWEVLVEKEREKKNAKAEEGGETWTRKRLR
jgi:hypothetical protein